MFNFRKDDLKHGYGLYNYLNSQETYNKGKKDEQGTYINAFGDKFVGSF